MKKPLITLSLCLLSTICFSQTPATKPDTLVMQPEARQQALKVIESAWSILGASVTPLKTDEAINLKDALKGVYQLLSTPVVAKQPADKPKTEKK